MLNKGLNSSTIITENSASNLVNQSSDLITTQQSIKNTNDNTTGEHFLPAVIHALQLLNKGPARSPTVGKGDSYTAHQLSPDTGPLRSPEANSAFTLSKDDITIHDMKAFAFHSSITEILYDNCCSYSVTNNLTLLYDCTPLGAPIPLSGIGAGVSITHAGYLRCLPATNGLNKCYYSKDATTTLISLGHLQRSGGAYNTVPHTIRLQVYGPNSILLDTPSLSRNNLFHASMASLSRAKKDNYTLYAAPSIIQLPSTEDDTDATTSPIHYKEQRDRADQVFELQPLLHYPSDDSLSADLTSGKIPQPYNHLTAGDVKVNRAIRRSCPHTEAGKHRHHPIPSSLTAPATKPGEKLSFDLEPLPLQHDGYTVEVRMVDEFSGHISIFGAKSKRTQDLYHAIKTQIDLDYKAYRHTVSTLHGDDEIVNASLRPLFGAIGVTVVLSLPGDHAHRIERYTLTLRGRSIATLTPLPSVYTTQ